jgi:predicted nucleotidyltransferase
MGLLEFLNKNADARKIFGERELKIIEKQLLGVNLTQSEKNRLSRDIRKKFLFIKQVSDYSSEFDLKKSRDNQRLILEVKKIILEDEFSKRINEIILFGSVVEKENTLLSDIDLAVKFDKIDEKEAIRFRLRIVGKFSNRLDLQVYNILPDKIKKEIDENGKLIYKRK